MKIAYHVIQNDKVVAIVEVSRPEVVVTLCRNRGINYHEAERLTAMKKARLVSRFGIPYNVEIVGW